MNSSNSFLRASAAAGICRRSATNRSNSALECLAFRRERSAAFPLLATNIAKANPVISGPTRFERNKCEHIANIVSIEENRDTSLGS
jgi:hypothetical protein